MSHNQRLSSREALLLFPKVLAYFASENGFVHPRSKSVVGSRSFDQIRNDLGKNHWFSCLESLFFRRKRVETAQGIRKTGGLLFFNQSYSCLHSWLSALTDGLAAEAGERASAWLRWHQGTRASWADVGPEIWTSPSSSQ